MRETWKYIKGLNRMYQISNLGRVKTFQPRYKTSRILKPGLASMGYLTVCLRLPNGNRRTHYIHRLIAKAFIPNPKNKRCINHIDGNKLNNGIKNLEWVTHKENNDHATKTGLRFLKMTPVVISEILRLHIRADKIFGAKGLAKRFNTNTCTIHEVLNKYKYGNTNQKSLTA